MKKILIIPDTHAPAHHAPSWNRMIRYGRRWKPDIIVHLGDFLDMYYASNHNKLAPGPALVEEFRVGNRLLDQLDSIGAKRKVFCMGNHETRLMRIVAMKLPEISDIIPSVPDLLGLEERGWEVYPYGQPVTIGKAHYVHEAGTSSNHMVLLKGGTNFVTGHTHRMEMHVGGCFTGEQHVAVMCGWLGDADNVQFGYASSVSKARSWTRGFVTGVMDGKGVTKFELHPLV